MTQDISLTDTQPGSPSWMQSVWQSSWLRGSLVPLGIVIIWEFLARIGVFTPNLVPGPSLVFEVLSEMTQTGDIWRHIGITLQRVALGFVIGSLVGTVLGSLTGYSRLCHQLLDPLFQALRSIPSLAWVPLFILWLGIYETSKVTLIAVGVFFPVYLSLMTGVQGVDRKLVEVGKIYRLSSFQLIKRVFLPATMPAFVVGIRGGLGLGWMFVVAAEIMGSSQGLGYLLVDGQTLGRPDITIASILLFAILGQITDALLALLSNRLLRWQDAYSSR